MIIRILSIVALFLTGCAGTGSPDSTSNQESTESSARVVLLSEHPFDLKKRIEGQGAAALANFLVFAHENDTDQIDTNYDKTKSLVTVIAGDYPTGGNLTSNISQVISGRSKKFTVENIFGPTSRNSPSVIINSYRVAVSAQVTAIMRVDGSEIARKKFRAVGSPDSPQSGYPTLPGDVVLSSGEIKDIISGRSYDFESGGYASFGADGSYFRIRPNRRLEETYVIKNNLLCFVVNRKEHCHKVVKDSKSNLIIIDDRSRRHRLEVRI